ncbi:hypothetical protein [Stenotrophomonas sp. TWI819]|uniref:hypothetical protein n=1 Tax=Stenotrophomonas sp. TWI819 TaxID=3136800 RepID=UPI00320B1D23
MIIRRILSLRDAHALRARRERLKALVKKSKIVTKFRILDLDSETIEEIRWALNDDFAYWAALCNEVGKFGVWGAVGAKSFRSIGLRIGSLDAGHIQNFALIDQGTELQIGHFATSKMQDRKGFGTALLLGLMRNVKEHHPRCKTVTLLGGGETGVGIAHLAKKFNGARFRGKGDVAERYRIVIP